MYWITRFLIFPAAPLLAALLPGRDGKRKKKRILTVAIICLLLVTLTGLFPPESYLVSFSSPEEAFDYCRRGEIVGVVQGESSCMIVYSTGSDSEYSLMFLYGNGGRYQLPNTFCLKTLSEETVASGTFTQKSLKDSEDRYAFGLLITDEAGATLTDGCGNALHTLIKESGASLKTLFFYGLLAPHDNAYSILFSGRPLS